MWTTFDVRARRSLLCLLALSATASFLPACGTPGKFVWYTELPREELDPNQGEYVIAVGDSLNVRVYEQEALSAAGRVRRDGRISMPLIGEVEVAGKHPMKLAAELETKLKAYIVAPRVTVSVETSQPIVISTIGELGSKGTITLESPGILIQAIAQAGGLTEFADHSQIFVLRQFPSFQRIRFTYDAIMNNENGAATFRLRTGDVLLVED